ncbi:MAG: ABC transporter permease [Bacillota bacterium]
MNKIKSIFASFKGWCKSLFVKTGENEPKLLSAIKTGTFQSIFASVIAACCGLIFGLLLMMIVDSSVAWKGFTSLLQGASKSGLKGVGNTLFFAVPLIMTGLSVGFAFKTGLFNIGAVGQFAIGIFCSLYAAYHFEAGWVVCLLCGMVGGMVWGAIPGIFKAIFNVNEVITSIMTNYIGMYLIDMLIIQDPIMYNSNYGWTYSLSDYANLPKWGLDTLFGGGYINSGIIIAIAIAIAMYLLLNKTTIGYELKACGTNKDAARYSGINEKRNIILAMVIAGGLAGIGGAMEIQAGAGNYYSPVNALRDEGFNGIAVALLGVSNPIGIIFAAIFFSHLEQGGIYLQAVGYSSDIIQVIMGVVIYFSALALLFKNLIPTLIKKFGKDDKDNANAVSAEEFAENKAEAENIINEKSVEETADIAKTQNEKEVE